MKKKRNVKKIAILTTLSMLALLIAIGVVIFMAMNVNRIKINILSQPYMITNYVPQLEPEDLIRMNAEELCEYYGVNVFPSEIPNDLKLSETFPWGIYENEERGIYWKQQFINYDSEEESNRRISIVVGETDENKDIWVGYVDLYDDENLEKSIIEGVEIFIGYYACEDFEEYCAEFEYQNIEFYVEGYDLSRSEFLRVVESIIEE